MNNIIRTALLCLFVTIVSCSPRIMEEMPQESYTQKSRHPHFVRTKAANTPDSLQSIVLRQHSPQMRLLDQTLFIDGKYVSAMTREEAATVGIPTDVFDAYADYLDRINKTDTNNK